MLKRHSSRFFLFIALQLALVCIMAVHAVERKAAARPLLLEKQALIKTLELTDLCLFTEARYTRHPAMADLHAPFQDGPLSFEHFPSGSLMPPQPHTVGNKP